MAHFARSALVVAAGLFTLAAAAVMPACSGSSHAAGTQPALIPSLASPIADVPVPAGFSMTGASTSQVVPATGLRFVDHQYKGGDDVLPVVRFYREQLPAKGWTLIDQNQLHHEITLRFTKNNEDAIITVWPGTFDTHIRVRIDPAGRNNTSR
jgi:hypothetical protein